MFLQLICGYHPHNSYLNRTRDPRGLRNKDPNKEHKNFAAALEYSGVAQSSVHNQHIFHKPRSADSGARKKIKVYKLYNIQRVKITLGGCPLYKNCTRKLTGSDPQARPLRAARDRKAVRECTRLVSPQLKSCHPGLFVREPLRLQVSATPTLVFDYAYTPSQR